MHLNCTPMAFKMAHTCCFGNAPWSITDTENEQHDALACTKKWKCCYLYAQVYSKTVY